jgi:dihydropteroate synthase
MMCSFAETLGLAPGFFFCTTKYSKRFYVMKLHAQGTTLDLSHPHVMGILNVTPDSFSDGGTHNTLVEAVRHANLMINAGATIVDVGGESTRPGAADVSVEEELERVIPVVEAIAQRFEVWISVDTSKPEVIRESARVGAHIINDIRSLTEPGALKAAAETGLPVCLMHMQGQPKTMQEAPKYDDVFADVNRFINHIARCERAGISKEKLLLDPGFGFGKNLSHNYALLARLAEFHHFNLPLLVGMSRKSMVGQLLNVGPNERLSGSLACAVIAAMQGAHIIRVHDVKETVEAMRVVEATLSASAKENKRYE